MTLSNLSEILDRYHEMDQYRAIVDEVMGAIRSTRPGQVFQLAKECPTFFKLGPLLFSNKIASLVEMPPKRDEESEKYHDYYQRRSMHMHICRKINEVLENRPFYAGFSSVGYHG